MSELKRCPFCGGEGEVHEYNSFWYKVGCNNQKCFLYITAQVFNSKEKAVEAWNTRKPMQNIVERLEHFNEETFYRANGRTNGKTLAYGYSQGIRKAIEIVKEEGLKSGG